MTPITTLHPNWDRPVNCSSPQLRGQAIDLSHRKLESNQVALLCDTLARNLLLRSLNLSHIPFIPHLPAVLSSLPKMCALTSLHLSNVGLGPTQMTILSASPFRVENLTKLDLSDNHLGFKGLCILALWLQNCLTLQALNLASNTLLGRGAEFAAIHLLPQRTALTSLDLSENAIDFSGGVTLIDTLSAHPSLTLVRLGYNAFGSEITPTLLAALEINTTLTELDLSSYNWSIKDLDAIQSRLTENLHREMDREIAWE